MFSHYSKALIALNFNFWRILKLELPKDKEKKLFET